jgi:uncharacterized DUF497 family protein
VERSETHHPAGDDGFRYRSTHPAELVVHTYRRDDLIRVISARKATPTEQATYLKRARK